jgi:hypothetical protein
MPREVSRIVRTLSVCDAGPATFFAEGDRINTFCTVNILPIHFSVTACLLLFVRVPALTRPGETHKIMPRTLPGTDRRGFAKGQ